MLCFAISHSQASLDVKWRLSEDDVRHCRIISRSKGISTLPWAAEFLMKVAV